jgi:hypothetical protein
MVGTSGCQMALHLRHAPLVGTTVRRMSTLAAPACRVLATSGIDRVSTSQSPLRLLPTMVAAVVVAAVRNRLHPNRNENIRSN